ncbi:MAG: peptidase M50 [Deltaproteobacteria bacterium RBG_19FT_COMBO_43_11]|nr:MAG: peptidase M50 [Deltaproteobacteria bacterium RBG_19FT_COMBO_43_11]
MFGRSVSLFKIFGFEIKIDLSWLILAALITWSLASGLFPEYYKELPRVTYWWMGVAGAVGLFLSIIFHELAHSLVARNYGISMKGITLFIFGGVAEMEDDPPSPRAEFWMAVVGPISSALISSLLFLIILWGREHGWPVTVYGVLAYLAWLNLVLAVFNLVPAFPLDGGRILRSALWSWKKNLRWATAIAAKVGSGLGIALIIAGIISIFMGNFVGGLWWFMIGLFIRSAAQRSYQQLLARGLFQAKRVKELMVKDPLAVSRSLSLEEFVNDYVYKYHFQMYPVLSFGKLTGCVSVHEAAAIPREDWTTQTVGSIAIPCNEDTTIGPEDDANKALEIMNRTGNSRLLVVEGDQLLGIISLKDMLKLLSLKVELKDTSKKNNST